LHRNKISIIYGEIKISFLFGENRFGVDLFWLGDFLGFVTPLSHFVRVRQLIRGEAPAKRSRRFYKILLFRRGISGHGNQIQDFCDY
jgi:hypothetical protein